MAKRRREAGLEAAQLSQRGISKRGWAIIAAGVIVVVAGFYVLSLVDRDGRNWAATASPALILAGYITMGFGIIAAPAAEALIPSTVPLAQGGGRKK